MAGTVLYEISTLHTYQRRLVTTALIEALEHSHLYVISRRPRSLVRTRTSIIGLRQKLITTTRAKINTKPVSHRVKWVITPRVSHDGAYWQGTIRNQAVHGEAWHLAALASDRDSGVCAHEVLYIGKSFEPDGRGNTNTRTNSHSKLQAIYERHQVSNWDIFVTPLQVEYGTYFSDDHIQDISEGPNIQYLLDRYADPVNFARQTVGLIEHLLISYFRPGWNEKLLDWTKATNHHRLAANDFRLVTAQFQGANELPQFWSETRPQARTHAIAAQVPGSSETSQFKIGTLEDLGSAAGPVIKMIQESSRSVTTAAEGSAGLLRIFGDDSPLQNPDLSR